MSWLYWKNWSTLVPTNGAFFSRGTFGGNHIQFLPGAFIGQLPGAEVPKCNAIPCSMGLVYLPTFGLNYGKLVGKYSRHFSLIGLVYLPTWMVHFYGKCRDSYSIHVQSGSCRKLLKNIQVVRKLIQIEAPYRTWEFAAMKKMSKMSKMFKHLGIPSDFFTAKRLSDYPP